MRVPRTTSTIRKTSRTLRPQLVSCLLWLLLLSGTAIAADPLYLLRPYDEITLDENNGGVRLQVRPLSLPGRKLPAAADRKEDLEIELVDRPGERFRLGWNNVAGIKFFEELVLAEADSHVKAGRFDEAYPYFEFLETRYPATAGLKEAVENYLWAQIGADFTAGRNDVAYALLLELHQRNPDRPGLPIAFERVTVKLLEQRLAAENFRAARGLLQSLTQRYPDKAAVTAPYEQDLRDRAAAALTAAREAASAGKFREARQTIRQALAIWPTVEGGRALAAEIQQRHPIVSVGVTSPAADWTARHTAPLTAGALANLGQVEEGKERRQFVVRLVKEPRMPDADLVKMLLAAADAQQPSCDPAWAELVEQVALRGDGELLITCRFPPLTPAAWLTFPLPVAASFSALPPEGEQAIFVRQLPPGASAESSPVEIIERTYADSAAALRGLKRGEVSVVDRVGPWELPGLQDNKEIVVGRYAFPTVHVLLPNPHRPLAANREFKRAILYAIDRHSILDRALLGGQSIAGCGVVSGPFPRGDAKNDPHGLAYDEEVPVRPYEPALALVLARAAPNETPPRPLVLSYPADEIPRLACQSIARQLTAAGIPVTLREEPSATTADDEYDLRYVELPMQEPLVDVWRLLGPAGMAGPPSPAVLLALRKLERAGDLTTAAKGLKEIHALAAAELPVLPLWQLVDHFAHHSSVTGIGERPQTLYQHVDQWQVELRLPSE